MINKLELILACEYLAPFCYPSLRVDAFPNPQFITSYSLSYLQLTTVNDGGLVVGSDGTASGASLLKGLDNLHGLLVSDLAEDDVATVEPRGDDSGDEELRAVAIIFVSQRSRIMNRMGAYVLGPALAMESRPGRSWVNLKFSSANFSP